MDDHGEGVADVAVEQDVHFHQLAGLVAGDLVIVGSVALGAALELIEEIEDHFVQRHVVEQFNALALILHVDEGAPLVLAKLHEGAREILGRVNSGSAVGFPHFGDFVHGGQVGGVVDAHFRAVGLHDFINDGGRGGHQIQVKFPL